MIQNIIFKPKFTELYYNLEILVFYLNKEIYINNFIKSQYVLHSPCITLFTNVTATFFYDHKFATKSVFITFATVIIKNVLFIDLLFHLFQYRLQTLFALTLSQLHISLYYSILHHIIFF